VVLTHKGACFPYMEFMNFGRATTNPVCNCVFKNFLGRWEIQKTCQEAITWEILTLLPTVMSFSFWFFFHMKACYQPLLQLLKTAY
jgi:hypothetical protein